MDWTVQRKGKSAMIMFAPLCSPSRTAIMTGVRPSSSGIYMNSPYFRISPALKEILTIPQYLSTYGDYYTAARGKIFHQPMGKYADSVSWDNFQNISAKLFNFSTKFLEDSTSIFCLHFDASNIIS